MTTLVCAVWGELVLLGVVTSANSHPEAFAKSFDAWLVCTCSLPASKYLWKLTRNTNQNLLICPMLNRLRYHVEKLQGPMSCFPPTVWVLGLVRLDPAQESCKLDGHGTRKQDCRRGILTRRSTGCSTCFTSETGFCKATIALLPTCFPFSLEASSWDFRASSFLRCCSYYI